MTQDKTEKAAEKIEKAPKTKPSVQDRVPIEMLAKQQGLPASTLLIVRTAMQWPIGYAVTPKDFSEAIDRAMNSPIR